ncbi:MAG: CcmD family protein [Bacteroidetes bacterium]|nr:CcmD family protein [Bacteroidota bacterium]HET6245041.1 CcmD family protein [Bacteroidia bacterium]
MAKNKWVLTLFLILTGKLMYAQGNDVEMADFLHQSGKIFVVVAVLLIIFTGILVYLITLDRKIGQLEKRIKD